MATDDVHRGAAQVRRVTTIFALASGALPAAIAVIRVSGPAAFAALAALTTRPPPPPRLLVRRNLVDPGDGTLIDRAMAVRFAAPASATGEDLVELHVHGGVAVVARLLEVLPRLDLTPAAAGDFTRRAFDNRRIDLVEAEALADLIAAETEGQRRLAVSQSGGDLGRALARWRATLIAVRANLEATLDFADADGVPAALTAGDRAALSGLADSLARHCNDYQRGARLRHGLTIVITGPPNAGKSSLLNALARREAAIVAPTPGTTRDMVEVRLDIAGVPVTIVDTAGRRDTDDPVEAIGVARGVARADAADLVIALADGAPVGALRVHAKADITGIDPGWHRGVLAVSALTGAGIVDLEAWLAEWVTTNIRPGEPPLIAHRRQHDALVAAGATLAAALSAADPVLIAEELRSTCIALDRLVGRIAANDVLDAIFGHFCIGK